MNSLSVPRLPTSLNGYSKMIDYLREGRQFVGGAKVGSTLRISYRPVLSRSLYRDGNRPPRTLKNSRKNKKGRYAGGDKTYDDTIPRGGIIGGNEKSKRKEATKER